MKTSSTSGRFPSFGSHLGQSHFGDSASPVFPSLAHLRERTQLRSRDSDRRRGSAGTRNYSPVISEASVPGMSPVEAILSLPEKFKGDERKALGKEQDKRNVGMAQPMNPGRQRCVTARKRTAGLGNEGKDRWWASGGQRWEGSSLAEPPTALKSKGILRLQESIWIKSQEKKCVHSTECSRHCFEPNASYKKILLRNCSHHPR